MNASFAERYRKHFSGPVAQRGQSYFDSGRVEVIEHDQSRLMAFVRGRGPEPYLVQLELAENGSLGIDCDCPAFADSRSCKHVWAAVLKLDELRGDGGPPHWHQALELVSSYAARNYQHPALAQQEAAQRRVWYVLNATESMQVGKIVIDLKQSVLSKRGERFSELAVSPRHVPDNCSPADAELLEMLLGNRLEAAGSRSLDWYRGSRVVVAPATHDVVLPRLAASGQLVWSLDGSLSEDNLTPLRWDDGEPFQLRLDVAEDQPQQRYVITGRLVRGSDEVPLEEAVFLLSSGLAVFVDSIARIQLGEADFGWIVALRAMGKVEVPFAERESLLERLSRLPAASQLVGEPFQVATVCGVPTPRLELKRQEDYYRQKSTKFAGHIQFVYGDRRFSHDDPQHGYFEAESSRTVHRDLEREAAFFTQPFAAGAAAARDSYWHKKHDLTVSARRLDSLVRTLTEQGWIVEAEGKIIRRAGAVTMSVRSGVEWFELQGEVDFEGVTVSLPALLRAARAKQNYVRLDDGSQGILPDDWLAQFGQLADFADDEAGTLRFKQTQALLLDALLAERTDVTFDDKFAQLRQKLQSFSGVRPASEPRGFHGTLRHYQREGLGWLQFLREFHLGGCLADDMGLGKTIQVLALLQARRLKRPKAGETRKPSIVVVPKSLVFNWLDEAARFTPRLKLVNYTGLDREDRLEEAGNYDLLVTTYGTLRRDIVKLRELAFDYAILDESQAIKNANSQAAKAARLLVADHRLAMTGTPIENNLGELWSLFEFLNPGMLGKSSAFRSLAKNADPHDPALEALAVGLRPFMLRRTKEQVLKELPEKTEQTLYCELNARQREDYEQLRDYYRANLTKKVKEVGLKRAKIHVLEALLRLRQAACHPGLIDRDRVDEPSAKLDALLDQLREVVAEGHKALVFSQFTSLLAIARKNLDAEGLVYEYLDGRTRKRAEKVKRFQEDEACPLFLISLKAGGHGLNLTAADYVFILDPWWNPAVEAQAIDRTHRIGQTRPVFAYRILCRNTVEDKILELQHKKRSLAEAIVSADNSLISKLSVDDLQLLLS